MVGLTHTVVGPHTPRMGIEEQAPDFVRELLNSQKDMGRALRATTPDVLILNLVHWVCTFN